MENNVIIDLRNISVKLGDAQILENLSMYIRDKEFITLLGPSGCGKTTTLRIIAGFLEPDSGEVVFENKVINGVPPHKRQVNTIFQRYALFPHLNVYENIAFGLRVKKMKEKEISETVKEMLNLVNLPVRLPLSRESSFLTSRSERSISSSARICRLSLKTFSRDSA